MGRRSAVGVMNGNFRGGMYYEYRKQVEADALKSNTEKKVVICKVCGGDVEAVPMYPELCYDCYLESIAATHTQPHPVNEAQEIEREMDRTLSASERNADAALNEYLAMRRTQTEEFKKQLADGTYRLRPMSSYRSYRAEPLTADEANYHGMDE